ncbi:isochorismatase family cysteine hydrolase [Chloroflexota bacterium]
MKALRKPVIYKNLRDIVGPEHTALVIWDVQNALVDAIFNKEESLHHLEVLIKAARSNNIPLIYSKITPLTMEYESPSRVYALMKRYGVDDPEKLPSRMQPGSPDAEIHARVRPARDDVILSKHTPSIFIGTHFEHMMRNRGIETILFTGISTEIGIDSSARDSANRGFYTVVVEDCVSSSDKEMHDSALRVLTKICIVAPSDDIMKEW